MNSDGITVSCKKLIDKEGLIKIWMALEAHSDNGFFNSTSWVYSWLETTAVENIFLLTLAENNNTVGLALFTISKKRRNYIFSPRTIYFFQAGVESEDQIWVEYNDILSRQGCELQIAEAVRKYFLSEFTSWDEINTGLINHQSTLHIFKKHLYPLELEKTRHYGVCFKSVREAGIPFRETLSKNTRYQINRCERAYAERGQISIELARTEADALRFFDEMGPLHTQRWAETGSSGFNNPQFVKFHRLLIRRTLRAGQLSMACLHVAGEPVGYVYNFVFRRKVYFYMGAFKAEQNNKLRPGLLAHTLLIEYFLQQDMNYYDFMGGDMRYKQSLANDVGWLERFAFQKSRPPFLAERIARLVKQSVSRRLKRQ